MLILKNRGSASTLVSLPSFLPRQFILLGLLEGCLDQPCYLPASKPSLAPQCLQVKVQAPQRSRQNATQSGLASFMVLSSHSLLCPLVPPHCSFCQENLPRFLPSIEDPLTVRKVCTQPCLALCIPGPCVCSSYMPAAAITHAPVCRFCVSRHAWSHACSPSERPSRARGLLRYVLTSQSLCRNRRCDSGSRHGNRRPSCHLLQSTLGPGHPLGFLEICSL